jgi:hypothetical protein
MNSAKIGDGPFQNRKLAMAVKEHQSPPMNLIYTVAFDPPGWRRSRFMAKILGSSLMRSGWSGRFLILKNFEDPVFLTDRSAIHEVMLPESIGPSLASEREGILAEALRLRFEAAKIIENPERYDWIIYMDADCLVLRDIQHLFVGEVDLLVQPEYGRSLEGSRVFNGYLRTGRESAKAGVGWKGRFGVNAGVFAVRGSAYRDIMAEWSRVYSQDPLNHEEFRDQCSFNKLLLDADFRISAFERGEIMHPIHLERSYMDYKDAAILHFVGGDQNDKTKFGFGAYMARFFWDEGGMLLDLLEA